MGKLSLWRNINVNAVIIAPSRPKTTCSDMGWLGAPLCVTCVCVQTVRLMAHIEEGWMFCERIQATMMLLMGTNKVWCSLEKSVKISMPRDINNCLNRRPWKPRK